MAAPGPYSGAPPVYLRLADGAVVIAIKAQPRASRTEIVGLLGAELKIKIAAPPVDSAANETLVEFIAQKLGCPKRAVVLLRGQANSHKQIAIHGMSLAAVAAGLAA